MKHVWFCLSLCFMSSFPSLQAAPFSLEAQLIGSQGKLDAGKRVYTDSTAGLSMRGSEKINETGWPN